MSCISSHSNTTGYFSDYRSVEDIKFFLTGSFLILSIRSYNIRKLRNYDSDMGSSLTSVPYLESYKKHIFLTYNPNTNIDKFH